MSKRRRTARPTKRYRVHFRELGYYQSAVDASSPEQAIKLVEQSPPESTFIASEERDVFAVDELQEDKTWKSLPDEIIFKPS